MYLRLIFSLAAALVACFVAEASSGRPRDLSLESVLMRATTYMKKGAARSAVEEWYVPYSNSAVFNNGPDQLKERFLFEYGDACIRASNRPGIKQDTKRRFLQQGIVAARQYIDWYHALGSKRQLQLSQIGQGRIGDVVHNLVELHIATDQRSKVLDILEETSQKSYTYINPQSLELWEEHLKLDSELKNRRTDSEIANLCQDDDEYKLHWELFREFLEKAKEVEEMKLPIRRVNARNRHVICGVRS